MNFISSIWLFIYTSDVPASFNSHCRYSCTMILMMMMMMWIFLRLCNPIPRLNSSRFPHAHTHNSPLICSSWRNRSKPSNNALHWSEVQCSGPKAMLSGPKSKTNSQICLKIPIEPKTRLENELKLSTRDICGFHALDVQISTILKPGIFCSKVSNVFSTVRILAHSHVYRHRGRFPNSKVRFDAWPFMLHTYVKYMCLPVAITSFRIIFFQHYICVLVWWYGLSLVVELYSTVHPNHPSSTVFIYLSPLHNRNQCGNLLLAVVFFLRLVRLDMQFLIPIS